MTTLEIKLNDNLSTFIQAETVAGGHASATECVLALLKDLQKKRAWEKAEALVIEGLESGEPMAVDDRFWSEMHRELRERYPEVDYP